MGTIRSSKPLSGAGCGVGGGFDSHALPPFVSITYDGGKAMKKRAVKKLQLHRETLADLEMAKGGGKVGAGTHYRSLCVDLCQPTDQETVLTD